MQKYKTYPTSDANNRLKIVNLARSFTPFAEPSLHFWMKNSFLHQTAVSIPPCPLCLAVMQNSSTLHSTRIKPFSILTQIIIDHSKQVTLEVLQNNFYPIYPLVFTPHPTSTHCFPLTPSYSTVNFSKTFRSISYTCRRKICSFWSRPFSHAFSVSHPLPCVSPFPSLLYRIFE